MQQYIKIGVALFIFENFVARGVLSIIEVLGPIRFIQDWPNDTDVIADEGYFFAILGVLGLIVYFGVDFIPKIIPEWITLTIGFFFLAGGCIVLIPVGRFAQNIVRFTIGTFFIWTVGSPITQTLVLSSFSKILGSQPQGLWMGWIGAAGSVGRIVFPIIAGLVSDGIDYVTGAIFSVIGAITIIIYALKKPNSSTTAAI